MYTFRVVYHDGNYPTQWIEKSNAALIANHMESNGFTKVNADMLKDWVELQLKSATASKAVVVMAQDVAPDTVFDVTRTDCLIRKFLDAGGRVVWIGDVPFFYRGHALIVPVQVQVPGGQKEPIGFMGQLAVLGSFSSIVTPKDQVMISRTGLRLGLRTIWPSERPVRLRFLDRKPSVLARATSPPKVRIEDILPQQGSPGEKSSAITQVVEFGQAVDAFASIGAATILLIALFISFVDPRSTTLNSQQAAAALLYAGVTIFLFASGIRKWLRNRFASAWVARFGEKGEFVRLWDYSNPQLNLSMLSELLSISSKGR